MTVNDWTHQENRIVVEEYLTMLEQELTEQSFVKARANDRVRAATGRSKFSVDSKFMNVSAVLLELQIPPIKGYKPFEHYQAALVHAVNEGLESRPWLRELLTESATRPAVPRIDFAWNVTSPPETARFWGGKQSPGPMHVDFVALEAANRRLGEQGELLVLQREQEQLWRAGRDDLAKQVRHVSKLDGDGLGYDIESWSPDGQRRHIEVKTTRAGVDWPMMVTRNEVAVSRELQDTYVLARVYDYSRRQVGLYELNGAIEDTCALQPESWRAIPKACA